MPPVDHILRERSQNWAGQWQYDRRTHAECHAGQQITATENIVEKGHPIFSSRSASAPRTHTPTRRPFAIEFSPRRGANFTGRNTLEGRASGMPPIMSHGRNVWSGPLTARLGGSERRD